MRANEQPPMIISVINHTNGLFTDSKVQEVIRAINCQIKEDFEPYWSMGATLRLEGRTTQQPNEVTHPDLRGDAIIYLWDKINLSDALGYHDQNFKGIPYSFVFVKLSERLHEHWSVTLSHEALEMIADPYVNLYVSGPYPPGSKNPYRHVLYWYEVCDAVQSDTYKIDGTEVSNFVLPLYFTSEDEFEGRNDYLGKVRRGKTLRSFGVNRGGYMGYYDPIDNKIHYIFADDLARRRLKRKATVGKLHRGARYEELSLTRRLTT